MIDTGAWQKVVPGWQSERLISSRKPATRRPMHAWIDKMLGRFFKGGEVGPQAPSTLDAEVTRFDYALGARDDHLNKVEREQREIATRLRLLEIQGNPRRVRHD